MKSGMLAAEALWEAIQAESFDSATLASFERRFEESWAYSELRTARTFHQGCHNGLLAGLINAGLSTLTGGKGFGFKEKLPGEPGYARMVKMGWEPPQTPRARVDNVLTFDKLTDVYNSGLANNLGNLYSRILTMCVKYFDGRLDGAHWRFA